MLGWGLVDGRGGSGRMVGHYHVVVVVVVERTFFVVGSSIGWYGFSRDIQKAEMMILLGMAVVVPNVAQFHAKGIG